MENGEVHELVSSLGSDDDSLRKMAAFKLQSVIGDPSFADMFIVEGGLPNLRMLTLESAGNTLAYGLTSLTRLLELDQGWEIVRPDLIDRVMLKPSVNGSISLTSVSGSSSRSLLLTPWLIFFVVPWLYWSLSLHTIQRVV